MRSLLGLRSAFLMGVACVRGLVPGLALEMASPGSHGLPAAGTVDFASTAFSGGGLSAVTCTADTTADDYGNVVADTLREDASTGAHILSFPSLGAIANGVTYYADLVVKADGRDCLLIQVSGATNNSYICVSLTTGIAGLQSGILSYAVTSIANGYKQVRMVFTSAAAEIVALNIATATDNVTYTPVVGDISKGLVLARFTLSH